MRTERCGDNRTQSRRSLQDARRHIHRHKAARRLFTGDQAFLPTHLALVCSQTIPCVHRQLGLTVRTPQPPYGNQLNVIPAVSCPT
ncbi:hypothetical protein PFLUV_G00248010 [Perca fluviatilis]|uniref:Uncharacterized protein n=1 Tax=Perca fluviatilis TaxID=8168 RepID=A0A6A5EDZ1_PERFL|nr:hypothetical protein PFLUV_G00248010 [Perca fluviatilis]